MASPMRRSRTRPARYILPTIANTSAAANGITVPPDLGISTINSPNPQAYPIVSQTFLVAYADMCKAGISQATASAVKKFLTYALGDGQTTLGAGCGQLPYAPLPASILCQGPGAAHQADLQWRRRSRKD